LLSNSVPQIDPTARIAEGARLADDVVIGPFCVVGPKVELRAGVRLLSHVNISGVTVIGERTVVAAFASLGTPPQSVKYRGGATRLVVGAECDIRENVTINIGTEDDRGVTEIGNNCLLMVGSHVGHDCKVGNNVTFANNVQLGGHVTIGDYVNFGGMAAVRQFVRIGEGAMIVGMSGVRADVIPWGLAFGHLADLIGLNIIGLKRRGFARSDIHALRNAYEQLFFGEGSFRDRIDRVAASKNERLIEQMIAFIQAGKRPLTMAIRRADAGEEI
jgi:UDP-N-acetylglucosamine acyltransferase